MTPGVPRRDWNLAAYLDKYYSIDTLLFFVRSLRQVSEYVSKVRDEHVLDKVLVLFNVEVLQVDLVHLVLWLRGEIQRLLVKPTDWNLAIQLISSFIIHYKYNTKHAYTHLQSLILNNTLIRF